MALWLKVVASITKQPKFMTISPSASWLWLGGVGYCRESDTDGFIPNAVMPTLAPTVSLPTKHAKVLCDAGLWERVEGGYRVHDYLDWNPSKADLEEFRKRDTRRKRPSADPTTDADTTPKVLPDGNTQRFQMETDTPSTWKPDALPDGNENAFHSEPSRARAPGAALSALTALDSAGESADFGEESARETHGRPPMRLRRVLARSPLYHSEHCPPWGARACEHGFCLPKYLWPQWEKRGGSTAEWVETLAAFVGAVMADTPPGIGDSVEKFWPAHFAQRFGTTAPKATSSPQSAAQRTLATAREGFNG